MIKHFLSAVREGIADVQEAWDIRQIWGNLAWFEIKARYKRTKLGPLWITLSTLIMLGAMGPLYAKLFNKEVGEYYLYISCGFIFWNYFTSNITENAKVLHESQGMVLSYGFPISMYIIKTVFRNIIVMMHNIGIVVLAIVIFSKHFGVNSLGFLAGFGLTVINMFFIGIIVSLISSRFRDMEQIIGSILTVMFFLTPILWDAKVLGASYHLLYLNPLFCFIDAMRTPLISNEIPYYSFLCLTVLLVIVAPLAMYMLGKLKHRVALWV